MQLAMTIFSDYATFIEKKRVENRLWPKSEFSWPKKIKSSVLLCDGLDALPCSPTIWGLGNVEFSSRTAAEKGPVNPVWTTIIAIATDIASK